MFPEGVDHDPTRRRPLHRRDLFRLRARAEAMPAAPTIPSAPRPV